MVRSLIRMFRQAQLRWHRFWGGLTFRRFSRVFGNSISLLWWIITYPFVMASRFGQWLWSVLVSAWERNNLRYFLQGLPALLALLSITVTTAYAYFRSQEGLTKLYELEGKTALSAAQYQKAVLCFERLATLDGRNPEVRYLLALSMVFNPAADQRDFAYNLLDQLAPKDAIGYPPAHLHQAKRILMTTQNPNAEQLRQAEIHLRRSLSPGVAYPLRSTEAMEAMSWLGRVLSAMNRFDEAEPYLRRAAPSQPELWLVLANIFKRQNRHDQVREVCQLAIAYYRPLVERNIDNVEARVFWAKSAALMDDYQQATKLLDVGYNMKPMDIYRVEIASHFKAWADFIRRTDPDRLPEALAHLEKALVWDPANLQALSSLLDLTRARTPEAERARGNLREMLVNQPDSPMLHFTVGLLAWEENKPEEARLHWERAYKLSRDFPMVANNLAFLLANFPPIDLRRALEIIDEVLRTWPDVPLFRGTRGHILFKLGRYKEALDDLERSIKDAANRENPDVLEMIANCYEQLGDRTMSETYRRRSKEIIRRWQEQIMTPKRS